jgi:hypothetical protein
MNFWIEYNLVEQSAVAKWSVKLASQDRQKINHLVGSIIEVDAQRVRQ